ncbi:YSIRK-type signal peptide-containing protein, partial [uncultured Streptococcus sp.]|uniref:mucin-binding protein n=1 Tax=uncultured Streptococcus sp. TaxID=83427 RepID=UPI0025DA8895
MGKFDKQLKYSIRKVSVGAASVVIGAFYLAMGAGVVHAETNTTTDGGASHSRPSPESETSQPNSLASSGYGAVAAQNPDVSGKSTEPTTPKEKENNETLNAAQRAEAPTSANTRSRRVRRETGDAPAGGTSNTSTGTETPAGASTGNNEVLDSAVTERKGSTVQPDQPGISIPKGNEDGAHDPNAHLKFDDPKEDATVEEMWKIIQHMPDDFQNNERSYLRNMDTLGRELRFDKTAENPEGVPLQPGEIRELHDFGGWHAIDENGNKGKFVIGRKNAQGYFTGWHKVGQTENGIPIIEQGGMLGADSLDNVYVHEQALDRRFDYMLMLVKGRTRANRNDTVADNSTYDPRTQNERAEAVGANFKTLPFLEKDKFNKYSPGVVGYNGIEKKFTAFSTKYGSRVRVDFVTGYITDINGSKGSYRVVIKAQNSKGEETKVYDETISRVAEIVQNEELYKKGLNVEAAHANILRFLKDEFTYRINKIRNEKVKNSSLKGINKKDYDSKQQELYAQFEAEATEEAKKQGDIVMNVTEDFLSIGKSKERDSEWKKTFTSTAQLPIKLANDLNNLMKNADKDNPNTPTWLSTAKPQAKADDRAYRLLTTLIPGAKKITYHVNDDQLEVETDKYTYTAARNGSKEVGIQGSRIEATGTASEYGLTSADFERAKTNTIANNLNNGWAKSNNEEFKHFSHILGVDKGIVRTNVISDEELSAKIKEAVGPGYSKLGKAGYFATADIPLGTDIVSYTVQVIPSDNERVGVNPQSSRIQYNMPILADFSVIQDTTGPSKEVAIRIIRKSNLPEDKKNKIIEEINKSKKTSEIRSAMSRNVKVRYVDKAGNVITNIENENTFGEKDSENRYTAAKDVLISSTYDVTARAYTTLSTTNNKYYSLVADNGGLATGSAPTTGTIDTTDEDKVVTFVYEETVKPVTPTTGKGVVHFKKQVSETVTEPLTGYGDITLSGNVGETFSSTDVDTRITALKNAGYEIVTNEFDTNSKTIDSTTDVDGQEPSQVYNVTVREKVVTVTTPPTPDTPIDPENPNGPKWTEELVNQLSLKKDVTRTITYVKKETADGPEIADAKPTKKQTAHFKRSATYNLVTKVVTPGEWTSTDKTLAAVPTEKLDGYVADKASVEEVETNVNSTDLDKKVVYTKLGSWIPNKPGEETPTPIPYPNHPTDPTKPGDPTPGTVPYVPGYTPQVGGNPLVPKNPDDLTEGYNPPVPTDPKTNTEITYVADPQKAVVKVFNTTTGTEVELPAEKVSIDNGTTDAAIPTDSVTAKIADLEKRGYVVENKELLNNQKFDNEKDPTDGDPTQVFKLLVKERTVTVTEPKNPNDPVDPDKPEGPKWPAEGLAKSDLEKEVKRTITYVKKETADGPEIENAKPTKKQTAHFKRSATYNLVTKVVTPGEWTSTDKT